VFASRDEDDLNANRGKPRTEVATDPSSTKHCHAHEHLLNDALYDDSSFSYLPSYV
jgi:hypothetical protein